MGELTQVTVWSEESNAASLIYVKPLTKAEITQFDAMLAGMIAYYPHQEIPEPTLKQFRAEFRVLAAKHGIAQLREALLATRRQPGRRFYPHPNEVADVLEEMVKDLAKKKKADLLRGLPKIGCEACDDSGLIIQLDTAGERYAKECECKLAWRRAKKEREAKG